MLAKDKAHKLLTDMIEFQRHGGEAMETEVFKQHEMARLSSIYMVCEIEFEVRAIYTTMKEDLQGIIGIDMWYQGRIMYWKEVKDELNKI